MKQKACIIIYRNDNAYHRANLAGFTRAIREAGALAICLAPQGVVFADGEVDLTRTYRSGGTLLLAAGSSDVTDVRREVGLVCESFEVLRIFPCVEDDVSTAALCRRDFKIPGLLPENAIHFRDKNVMSRRAEELGIRVAAGVLPHTLQTIRDFIRDNGFPIIIKPFDGLAGRDTYKVSSEAELERVWEVVRDTRHDYRVEQFIVGPQYHVDMLFHEGEPVFQAVCRYTHTVLEYQNNKPLGSVLRMDFSRPPESDMVRDCCALVRGFGLKTGVIHAEFFLPEDGRPVFGEVGARLPGGFIVPLYAQAFGVHLACEWARAELASSYSLTPPWRRATAAEFITTSKRGRLLRVEAPVDPRVTELLAEVKFTRKPGDLITDPRFLAHDTLGYYIVKGDSEEDAFRALDKVREHFTIEMEPVSG
ncbi:ATP-grasp domain-containing protein [Corallococcus exercitus]|uniref:ATP-grasp domain-containing protein n=1 Tax=Corallococcus exercitus TaxID=2316736 RepID=A0A3A8IGF4_9BACT|nr:ATP-grasp domain-containing protein [Corallococcus exercitus]NOK35477.1 ATP-grasp domain-containing protein [Corallococcus exercitus]RKG77391.1 ATP-grasp domain-containing protein [Corallococcus exercitus]